MISANDFNPALPNHPDRTINYNANVTVKQPLVNEDMWHARRGAKLQADMYAYSQCRQEASKR